MDYGYGPYAIRTHYLPLRRRPLYPSELMGQIIHYSRNAFL